MTTSAELLNIYADYTAAARREYADALAEHRLNYLNGVAELSGLMTEELPRPGDMPVYIGRMRDLTDQCNNLLEKAMFTGRVEFVVLPYWGHPHSLRNITKPDDPVFAFFHGEDHVQRAITFTTELAALQTPAPVVVKKLGNLGDLTINQAQDYGSAGVLRMLWREVNGKLIYDHLLRDELGRWCTRNEINKDRTGIIHDDIVTAFCYWAEDHDHTTPVEFLPNPTA